MALGRVIVRQLELDDRGTVLARWTAHHLAEVIAEASQAAGSAKVKSEAQAVDLVLKLWTHRRALPEPVDPLGGYRKAVEVLGQLTPEANPWENYHQTGTYDSLLRQMFRLLAKIVLSGVLLTQVSHSRQTTEEELKALEEEERYWHSTLQKWWPLVGHSRPRTEIKVEFVDTTMTERAETDHELNRVHNPGDQDHELDRQMEPDDTRLHAMILSDLEHMQTDLNGLLTRWRESSPDRIKTGGEISGGSMRDHTTTVGSLVDTFGDEEEALEKVERKIEKEAMVSDQPYSFWSSLPLVDLAKLQNVAPVDDLEDIVALWPSDDDSDELMDHVLLERAARRQAVGNGSGR